MTTWLELINAIPGLGKAITELVGDISRVGSSVAKLASAKIDEPRRAIEDRTDQATATTQALMEARTALTKAVAQAAVDYVESNAQKIGERALLHGVERLLREQNNREAVVMKTIEQLTENPPAAIIYETPSSDWLNLFGRHAENATSEQMREHWAHILSGEIRRPGMFSFATLHVASILDEPSAQAIDLIRPWLMDNNHIPLIGPWREGLFLAKLMRLAGIGFIQMNNHAIYVDQSTDPNIPFRFETDGAVVLIPKDPVHFVVSGIEQDFSSHPDLPCASLSLAGVEMLSVLPHVKQTSELAKAIAAHFTELGWKGVTIENPNSKSTSASVTETD